LAHEESLPIMPLPPPEPRRETGNAGENRRNDRKAPKEEDLGARTMDSSTR
jgi:hypothetical protein